MSKSVFIALIIALLSIAWIGSGFILPSDEEASTEKAAQNGSTNDVPSTEKSMMQVRVIKSTAQDYKQHMTVNGRTHASKNITIRAEAEGQITSIRADEGSTVTKGAEIIKIDIRERKERVREAQELVKQRQIEYDAARKLIEKGYTSDVRLAQTQSALEAAKANLTQAQIVLEKTTVIAPFDGILGVRHVDVGDYVRVGDEITDMVDLDPLQVTVFVNENNIVQLKKGDKAELTFANGEKREGILSFIAPAADEESRTFQVDVDLANDDNAIPAGLTTQVQIDGTSQKAHSISPAILTLDDTGAVGVKIVDENNIVRYIPVHIIADKSDKMWVTGLPDSANIITVGQDFVADGQQVNPVMVEQ